MLRAMNKFILLTAKDPWVAPTGGTSSFARQLLHEYKDVIAVASMTSEKVTARKWIDREYQNWDIKFLCLGRSNGLLMRFIPARVLFFWKVLINRHKVKELGIKNIFIDSPEAIWGIDTHWESVCYIFHGLNNPVSNSRFKSLRFLGNAFEKLFVYRLKRLKPECILAASGQSIINEFNLKTGFNIMVGEITMFPTRVDNTIFYPVNDTDILRKDLGVKTEIVFTSIGRLARIKGWDLILEAFELFHSANQSSTLIFVGDGEDHQKIIQKVISLRLQKYVIITGMLEPSDVAKYINISDLCLVGSFREGWSVAMCEILACGKAIVSTSVSGASDMIIEGENGFIVNQRNPKEFYSKMRFALELKNSQKVSLELSKLYRLSNLKNDLESLWSPIKGI